MILPGLATGANRWTFASDSSGAELATSCDSAEATSGHMLIKSIMSSDTAGNRLPSSTRPSPLTASSLISPLSEYLASFILDAPCQPIVDLALDGRNGRAVIETRRTHPADRARSVLLMGSQLEQEHTKFVGRTYQGREPILVTAERIACFCAAVGETNRLYVDEAAAARGP